MWRDDLMNNRGTPIIGLGPRTEEFAELPLQWMVHIQVADVAETVARALEHGGKELMHAKGDDGTSQWAVLLDPNGAAFGIMPVVPAEMMPPKQDATQVGHISWVDLTVADAAASCEFYRKVVGWEVVEVEMDEGGEPYVDYDMLGADTKLAAAIRHARGANSGLPAVWMICLSVGDLGESVRRVREGGGEVVQEVRGEDGELVRAVIRDPLGVVVSLVCG